MKPVYEKLHLAHAPNPGLEDVAALFFDDGNPVHDYYVCFLVQFEKKKTYAIAHMAAEDTTFFDFAGKPPENRGLETGAIYRVVDSFKITRYDQTHIVICLVDRTIEFTGVDFGVLDQLVEAPRAINALLKYLNTNNRYASV